MTHFLTQQQNAAAAHTLPGAAMVNASRYLIVPCEADGCGDLAVIWDRLEEQVVDVISAAASAGYSDEDALWDEGRSWAEPEAAPEPTWADRAWDMPMMRTPMRMAA